MAESTLSLSYTEIAPEVSDHLGYGRTIADWSTDQEARVHRVLDKGYRDFLNSHPWSFLRKFTTLAITSTTDTYDLPDDFASFDGDITYGEDNNYNPITITGEPEIRRKQTGRNDTMHPYLACVRPKTNDGTSGQRYEIVFFPSPDGSYTLYYGYHVITNTRLRSSTPYPLGGMLYGEAIQMCCIAAADRLFRDMPEAEYRQNIQYNIIDAVRIDGDRRAKNLGYNGDAGCGQHFYTPQRLNTYNGSVGA
jgi:hypothetical protein